MSYTKRPEILAPAGDFSTAVRAFEAGADAVYLGLKDFSARKGATNFDYSELRRLKFYTKKYQKSFYITLNTLIEENEFEKMHETLSELELIEPTALIVQDLGLASFIKQHFPSLTLHASTQMAIHNSSGVAEAKAMGIERVVLSRELSFEQIKTIRNENPEMELEVFIHGALCYSFSGLCLASGLLLNRSGNRGQCAQLCRNFYKQGDKEFYPFSCNDLALDQNVLELAKIGIHSFKIEGRLKSKEYVQSTVRYYKTLLEKKDATFYQRESKLSFSRKQTSAYFEEKISNDLIGPVFPGHRGLFLGTIEKSDGRTFTLTPQDHVERNDTLLLLNTEGQFARFTAFQIRKLKSQVEIIFEDKEGTNFKPQAQDAVYLIHKANQTKVSEIDYKTISEEKSPLPLTLIFKNNQLSTSLGDFDLSLEEAKGNKDFTSIIIDLFKESSTSRFCFSPIEIKNETAFQNIFIPLSLLKKIKNTLYEKADALHNEKIKKSWRSIHPPKIKEIQNPHFFEIRKNLNPSDHPFAHLHDFDSLNHFKKVDGKIIIPLHPILREEKPYYEALEKLIISNPSNTFLLGLNNLGHIKFAQKFLSHKNVNFFADFYLYTANSSTLDFLYKEIPTLLFSYSWIEGSTPVSGTLVMKDKVDLPYFISLGCFQRHNVFKGKCPDLCKKSYTNSVRNGGMNYKIIVKDCLTYLFRT